MKKIYIQFQKYLSTLILVLLSSCAKNPSIVFDSHSAFQLIQRQIDLGPRVPGTSASYELSNLIKKELENTKWKVEYQDFQYKNTNLRNIVIKPPDEPLIYIIGSHYDTRKYSDKEITQEKRLKPVPGANDGASGTALLIEMAKSLDPDLYPGLGFIFFDAEDQGQIDGWDWSVGAEYFVENLSDLPDQVIIIDMVGDRDLNIYKEANSDIYIVNSLWEAANDLGFSHIFINEIKYSMMDDHSPFLRKNIPAALLIDFDYPYWHTNSDALDKVSAESLAVVADVINKWLDDHVKLSK